jgi:hypothetical protein
MRTVARRLLTAGGALTLVVAIGAMAAPVALAGHDTAKELCGRAYTKNKQVIAITKNVTGPSLGRLVLVKNRHSRTYCAAVIRKHHKRKRFMRVRLTQMGPGGTCEVPEGCPSKQDAGRFKRYAGPLYFTKLDGGCIDAYGLIGGAQIGRGLTAGNCT